MQSTRIKITNEELDAMKNRDFLLIKHRVIEKVQHRLGNLGNALHKTPLFDKQEAHQFFFRKEAKVSKGEQLEQMPYVVLDYPKISTLENLCSIRVLFWWGHYFTCQWILSGTPRTQLKANIYEAFEDLQKLNLNLYTGDNLWEHRLDEHTHQPLDQLSQGEFDHYWQEQSFTKLGFKLSLNDESVIEERVMKFSQSLADALAKG